MLTILLIIPTISILTIWLFCHKAREVVFTALAFSILNLIHTLFIMHLFDSTTASFQFNAWGVIGIDGISLWLIWLVNMLMPIVI